MRLTSFALGSGVLAGGESQPTIFSFGLAAPKMQSDPFAGGVFEVFEILLEGRFVELGEELGLSGGVVATDVVNQLTFIHDGFTLQNGWSSHLRCNTGGHSRWPITLPSEQGPASLEPEEAVPDLQEQRGPVTNPGAQGENGDSLAKLYHMSTTAGWGRRSTWRSTPRLSQLWSSGWPACLRC